MADFTLHFESQATFDAALKRDFDKGRAFVPSSTSLNVFDDCSVRIDLSFCSVQCDINAQVMLKDTERGGVVGTVLEIAVPVAAELRQKVASTPSPSNSPSPPTSSVMPEERPYSESPPSEDLRVSPLIRLKPLSMPEKLKLAKTSRNQTERRALARLLDASGWEALLSNPNISTAEVAMIARKATVPFPLIERIALNGRWAKQSNIRRALLANPKLSRDIILRLLRITPQHELKLAPKQTAYPVLVRTLASEMLASKK